MNETISSQDVQEIKRHLERIAAAVEVMAAKADPEYARELEDKKKRAEETKQRARAAANVQQQRPTREPSAWA
jgi:hypothetical protein